MCSSSQSGFLKSVSLKCRETIGGMLLCAITYQSTLFLLQARSDFSTTLIAFFPFLSLSFLTLKKERKSESRDRTYGGSA